MNSAGEDLPASYQIGGISRDGRLITFNDDKNAWLRDRVLHKSTRFWHEAIDPESPFPVGTVGRTGVSGDGRYVAFSSRSSDVGDGDTDGVYDVFRLSLATGHFAKVSVAVDGGAADQDSFLPSLSYTGRYVGFSSVASNLIDKDTLGTDTFVRDMRTAHTQMTSAGPNGPGNSDSGRSAGAVSADGLHMVYESYASDLVTGDTNDHSDVYWWEAPGT